LHPAFESWTSIRISNLDQLLSRLQKRFLYQSALVQFPLHACRASPMKAHV